MRVPKHIKFQRKLEIYAKVLPLLEAGLKHSEAYKCASLLTGYSYSTVYRYCEIPNY